MMKYWHLKNGNIFYNITPYKMIDLEELYKKFCEALPEKNLTEEQKKQIFELMLRVCYNYINRK